MGANGHAKGARGELAVRDLILPWLRTEYPEAQVVRTPQSGGWMTGRDLFDARGDLMITREVPWPWCVEVKWREAVSVREWLAGRASPVWTWWTQACDDADASGLAPMLWFRKRQGLGWTVLLPRLRLARACPRAPLPTAAWSPATQPWGAGREPVAYSAGHLLDAPPAAWIGRPGAWADPS